MYILIRACNGYLDEIYNITQTTQIEPFKAIGGGGMSRDKKYKFKRCQLCGKMIEKSHNRKIYCDDCRENMRLNRYKKYNQKRHNHN